MVLFRLTLACSLILGAWSFLHQLPASLSATGHLSRQKSSIKAGVDFSGIVQAYQSTMQNNGLIADMVTVLSTNTLSDFLAQSGEKSKKALEGGSIGSLDFERLLRFAVFGFFDGAVGHGWFIALDQVIKGTDAVSIIEKISADTLIYTPVWCAWFVVGMSILKRNFDVVKALKYEWKELLFIDLGLNFLILKFLPHLFLPV
jgi:hypothetical protein